MEKIGYINYEEKQDIENKGEQMLLQVFDLYIKVWKYHFAFSINRSITKK